MVVDYKLPDHVQVPRRVGNQALLGGMVLLDGAEDLDGRPGGINFPGRCGKDLLLALQFTQPDSQQLLRGAV